MIVILIFNFLLAIAVLYMQRKDTSSMLFWFVVVLFLPILGIALYVLFADGARFMQSSRMKKKTKEDKIYIDFMNKKDSVTKKNVLLNIHPLARLNLLSAHSNLTNKNDIKIFGNNTEYFEDLLKYLNMAEIKIYIEMPKFDDDVLGIEIRQLLIDKAKSGVEVHVVYDDVISRSTSYYFFRPLILAGGKVYRFSRSWCKLIDNDMAYRNNRSIVIIDSTTAYMGGAQFSKKFLGQHKRLTPWHDMQCRLQGEIVDTVSIRYYQDFNFASKKYNELTLNDNISSVDSAVSMQYVATGPDVVNVTVSECINKLISTTKQTLSISSGTMVLDKATKKNIELVIKSGVNTEIFVSNIYKNSIEKAITYYTVEAFRKLGAKIYFVDGYINTTSIVSDGETSILGAFPLNKKHFYSSLENLLCIFDNAKSLEITSLLNKHKETAVLFSESFFRNMKRNERFWLKCLTIFYGVY